MPRRDPISEVISPRSRWILAALAYLALACVWLWPIVRDAGTVVTRPGDDAMLVSWILWWNAHAVPLTDRWWNAPFFYPSPGAMAFSEILLGQMPIAAPVEWLSGNPVLAHNIAVLLSFPLCALAAHALAFELTRRHDAAVLAALAFGFGAIKANHIGHLQMLSYYWAPIVLVCLHRSLRGPSRVWWLAGAAGACLMQVLCNGYALFQLPLLILAWIAWFPSTLRQRLESLAALGAGLLPMLPILLRYRAIHTQYGFSRSITEVLALSADVGTLLGAPAENVLLGTVLSAGASPGFFPGLTVAGLLVTAVVVAARHRSAVPGALTWDRRVLLALAIAAAAIAASSVWLGPWAIGRLTVSHAYKPLTVAIVAAVLYLARGPRWRGVWHSRSVTGFYAAAAGLFFVLSFGPQPRLWGERIFYQAPYAWLTRLPGFSAVRAPDRMTLLAILCLAVVVALTYARWADALRTRRAAVWLALCAGLLADGVFRIHVQPLPHAGPAVEWRDVRAVIELPLVPATDASAMYRSMRPGPPIVNGTSGYAPPHYPMLRDALEAGDFRLLQELGGDGALGVAIDRLSPDHERIEPAVARLTGATLEYESSGWAVYRVPHVVVPEIAPGAAAEIARVRASPSPDEAARMIDGRIETVWSSAGPDGEEVVVELREVSRVSGILLEMGDAWFQFPRTLSIDASLDGSGWAAVWAGETSTPMARAALEQPKDVPLVLTFDPTRARFIRLRRGPSETRDAWTIGELSVQRAD